MRPILILLLPLLVLAGCKNRKQPIAETDLYYTCSMHPEVHLTNPGNCPICGMKLIRASRNGAAASDEIQLTNEQIRLGNIAVDSLKRTAFGDQLLLTGTLNFDQLKAAAVSARVMGRIEKLYYRNLGDYVQQGAPLFELYSEELNNAKQEYLLALDRLKTFANGSVIDIQALLESARHKLLLWGMTPDQIEALRKTGLSSPLTTYCSTATGYITQLDIREGDYVMEGGTIVKLADLSTLWAEAQIFTSQLSDLSPNSIATVQLPDFGNKELKGRIEFVNPEISPDTRINLLRVSIPNPGHRLKPGMPAYVILKSPRHQALSLPIDAVIRDGKGASVWVQIAPNTFKTIMVTTGLESGERLEIVEGLDPGDKVVVSGAYLLQSEYIFKKGANPMTGHDMKNM